MNHFIATAFHTIAATHESALSQDLATTVAGIMAFMIIVSTIILLTKETLQLKATGADAPPKSPEIITPLETIDRSVKILTTTYDLTSRETEIMVLLGRGYTLPRIARELFISLDTVRAHSKNIYRKLGIHKKQQLLDLIDAGVPSSPDSKRQTILLGSKRGKERASQKPSAGTKK